MRIHRSARTRFFTVMGNEVLRDNRLSFCARGILAYLLSLPDGRRGDIRTLAALAPEGRERVAAALRELEALGYLRRAIQRTPEGRIYTETDVFDSVVGPDAQVAPGAGIPGSGDQDPGLDGDHLMKDRDEESPLPAQPDVAELTGREGDDVEESKANAALLARVGRIEPRLVLGQREALQLVPLVAEWRRRGASEAHVVGALTAGLPRGVYHPARFIETRLRTKMPAEPHIAPSRPECDECGVPVPEPGACRSCRTVVSEPVRAAVGSVPVGSRGVALVRAALRGVSIDTLLPSPA